MNIEEEVQEESAINEVSFSGASETGVDDAFQLFVFCVISFPLAETFLKTFFYFLLLCWFNSLMKLHVMKIFLFRI